MTEDYEQGIRRNWRQFLLHAILVFATGLALGAERNVVPIIGEEVLGVESFIVIGSFVVSFGFVKALLNLYAGKWGETYGRKPVLILGWLTAIPIPAILIFAPNWWWITAGNILLGVNQGLTWSMAVNAKIDLAGPEQRGLAVGIDEAFGYSGVAVGAWLTGVIATRTSLRPEPFYFMAAVIVLAILLSVFLVHETLGYVRAEAAAHEDETGADLPFIEVVKQTTYGDRTLFAATQAGHIENFVDTLVWIAFPLYLTSQGLNAAQVGVIVGVHSGAYFLQLITGELGDRIGRRPPVIWGMFIAGGGVLGMLFVEGFWAWTAMSGLSGVGMALLYTNLMTVAGDAPHPTWRAAGMGVYRMWRDAGYGVGAILIGLAMDAASIEAAFYLTGILMIISGMGVLLWMEETHPEFGAYEPRAVETEQATVASTEKGQ